MELDTYIKGYLESQRASMKYAKAGNNRHVTPHGVLVERPETLSIINDIRKAKTLEEISTFKTADYYAMGLPNEDVYTIGNEIRRQQLQIKKNKANNIPVWVDQSHFSKSNITTLKGRLNSGKIKTSDIPRIERGRSLDPDFIAKGHASMKKTAFKKNGDPRSNSPFGHRENAVLRNLKEIRFDQFTNISRYGQDSFYVPVYSAYDHEGNGFQYYYAQGYNITG